MTFIDDTEVRALPAKWRDRAANNPGSFAAAANVVCADELERVMSDWTSEDDRKAAESKVASGKCDGSCRPHSGTPRLVEVEGWGFFSYCDEAIAEDGRRGIALTVIDGGDSAATQPPSAPVGVDMERFREPVVLWGKAYEYDRHGREAVVERRKPIVDELLAIIDAAAQQPAAAGEEPSKGADVAQPKRRPYNASGSLSEYGVFPECDVQQPADARRLVAKLAAHVRPTCSELWDEAQAFLAALAQQPAATRVRCGDERYELDAYLWRRESTQEWVLELSGAINNTSFTNRFPVPLSYAPEDAVSLPNYAPQPAAVDGPCRMVDGVVTVNGIALDEVVRLGDRYAAAIEKRGMPRAAQVFEALVLIGKHALAAQKQEPTT